MRQSTFHTAKEAEYLGYLEASLSNSYGYNEEGLFSKAAKAAKPSFAKRNAGKLGVLGGLGVGGGSAGAYAGHLKGQLGKAGEEITGLKSQLGEANENINILSNLLQRARAELGDLKFENLNKTDQIDLLSRFFKGINKIDMTEALRIFDSGIKPNSWTGNVYIPKGHLADGANIDSVKLLLKFLTGLN
jgi:hypothetical protein